MWPLFATTAAYAMNTFASEALSSFSPFQLVFLRDLPDLTSLSFPKINTIPVNYHKYYNLSLARAQMIGRLLLEWRTQQDLEYENKMKQYTKEEIFQDDQMVYSLAPHSSALQTDTTKFKQDFIGPLYNFRQDTLQAERCHWASIGWHVSCKPNQQRLSVYPTRYS